MSIESFKLLQSTVPFVPAFVGGQEGRSEELRGELKETMQSIARRAYELYEGRGREDGHDLADWLRAESELLIPLRVGIEDSRHQVIVRALVPGFSGEEIMVSVEPRRLIIYGPAGRDGESQTGSPGGAERPPQHLLRTLDLSAEVDPESITATLEDGILEVRLRKVTVV